MGRRAFREKRSKFSGTKNVLQNLNQAAHAIVHDLDVSLPSGSGGGYMLFWNSNTFIHTGDVSQIIVAPAEGTIENVYCSLPQSALGSFIIQVYKNGSPIFSLGARPEVLPGNDYSLDAVPDVSASVAPRDAFEVEISDDGGNPGRAIVYIIVS